MTAPHDQNRSEEPSLIIKVSAEQMARLDAEDRDEPARERPYDTWDKFRLLEAVRRAEKAEAALIQANVQRCLACGRPMPCPTAKGMRGNQ